MEHQTGDRKMKETMTIKLRISSDKDRGTMASILLRNGYKIWIQDRTKKEMEKDILSIFWFCIEYPPSNSKLRPEGYL